LIVKSAPRYIKALDEYIQNRYDGFLYTFEQISNEFEKKISSNPNNYDFILSKTNLTRIELIIDMIIYVASNEGLNNELKSTEIEFILNAAIEKFNNPELTSNFIKLVLIKFQSLPIIHRDIITNCLKKYF